MLLLLWMPVRPPDTRWADPVGSVAGRRCCGARRRARRARTLVTPRAG